MSEMQPGDESWVDERADRFERAWAAGEGPRLEDHLADVAEPRRSLLLEELMRVEIELRGGRTAGRTPEEYRRRFPDHDAVIDQVFTPLDSSGPGIRRGAGPNDLPAGESLAVATSPFSPPTDGEWGDASCNIPAPTTSPDPNRCGDSKVRREDATLTYSVARHGGRLGPPADAEQRRRLCDAFSPGGLLQGRYRIDQELGRGAMGVVFLGRDLRLDRPVAVKVSILIGRASEVDEAGLAALRTAFAEEARLGANLSHPAIATVYDYGFHEDKPFTVFEYLPGETLRDLLLRRGRLPLEEARLVVGPLAQALDFAHARRVVHRDLKPDNVRATEQGLFKVLDLGLAREFGRDVDWSGFAGTPAYAAPEQAAGLPCDGRADQYALALIAYELLTGRRLFRSSDPYALLALHRDAEPEGFADDLADVPATVRNALARALSKDRNARFATCGDFAVALGCHLLNAPTPAPEILLESDVERMTIGRFARWVSIPRLNRTAYIHVALTREAVWSAYHTEVRRWPLAGVERVEPQLDPLGERGADAPTDVEDIRRLHLGTESIIRVLSRLHYIALMPVMLALALVIRSFVVYPPPGGWTRMGLVAGVLSALGFWLVRTGLGLRRFQPWARWAALAESSVVLVSAAGLLVAVAVDPRPPGSPDRPPARLMLPLGLVIAPAAFAAWFLLSRKASVAFTPSYREVVDRTRQIDPRIRFDFRPGQRPARRTLRLTLRAPDGLPSRLTFRFPTTGECERWARRLVALVERPADPAGSDCFAASWEPVPVVLLQRPPTARYQLLGPVEAKSDRRSTAESGLLVRAAMMGADAVVDLQEEALPDFRRTVRRLTGTAVRAADVESRFEFRSRWYADRVARVSGWAIVLLLTHLFRGMLYTGMLYMALIYASVQGFNEVMMPDAKTSLTPQTATSDLFPLIRQLFMVLAAFYAWPLGLAALVRGLRWPQFVRPLAVTLVGFAFYPACMQTGALAAAVLTGGWSVFAYHSSWMLDPIGLGFCLFALFLGRIAWRADREFRLLVPDPGRETPLLRSLGGRLALGASVAHAVLLGCYLIWEGYMTAFPFRLPT